MLINLAGNAFQYIQEDGKIVISAKCIKNEIQISVRDTGIGIPPEHLMHIFVRFYRVDKSRSRQSGGERGMDLTIVRAIVEAHEGSIRAESADNETDSVFIFALPVSKPE